MRRHSGIMGRMSDSTAGLNSAIIDMVLGRATYHAVYDESVLDALQGARASGFRGVQVATEMPHLAVDRMSAAQLDEIAAYRAENDLILSLAAPTGLATFHASSAELMSGVMSCLGDLLNAAERLGAHAVVVRLAEAPRFPTDDGSGRVLPANADLQFRANLRANLMRLAGLGLGRCAVCIENHALYEMACEALEPLVREEYLHLCWDAALAVAEASPPAADSAMARLFADYAYRIRIVNLHDVRDGRAHSALGTGCVDLAAAIEWLYPLDVREWCVQVRPREAAQQSLEALKRAAVRSISRLTSDG